MIPRAEEHYELASKILGFGQMPSLCEQVITNIRAVIVEFLDVKKELAAKYAAPLQSVRSIDILEGAEEDIRKALKRTARHTAGRRSPMTMVLSA